MTTLRELANLFIMNLKQKRKKKSVRSSGYSLKVSGIKEFTLRSRELARPPFTGGDNKKKRLISYPG